MARKPKQPQREPEHSSPVKPPEDWTTGDEPMTGARSSYLHTLATEAGETVGTGPHEGRGVQADR